MDLIYGTMHSSTKWKQTHRHGGNRLVIAKGEGVGEGRTGSEALTDVNCYM